MIWNKINNHLHIMRMDPVNKICKFFHTLSDIDSQIRIYIIIVCNGIWRACNALDCVFVYRWYSVTGIVTAGGMRYYACKPDMCCTHFTDSVFETIREMGTTHIWFTGIIAHASCTDYSRYGIPSVNKNTVKGIAGSPYAITDYYDIDPDLAVNVR